MNEFLNQTFLNNRVLDYAVSLGIFAGAAVLIKIADLIVINRLKKLTAGTKNQFDDQLVKAVDNKIVPLLYFGALYLSTKNLAITPLVQKILAMSVTAVVTFLAAKFVLSLAIYSIEIYWRKREGEEASPNAAYRGILLVLKLLIWGLALILLLDNFGVKISALVAGLGIGGLAVAFAAQKVLGDLFSYFSIFFDRPFAIGDFIMVDNFMGTVEHIGIKSTRIRSLGGEQLIFANTDLTNSRLRNYKQMASRRVVFNIGITYGTGVQQVKEIPKLIEKIIRDIPDAVFDRAHFSAYGDFSLNFEIVYYVKGGDYLRYMDIQQQINLSIMEAFAQRKIEFAYPTQTVYVNK